MDAWNSKEELVEAFRREPGKLVSSLIAEGTLRGQAHVWLGSHILETPQEEASRKFFWIPLMPWYLSLDFTAGACNLNCRFCSGKSLRDGKLSYISKEQFRKILRHIPTADMVSLPSESSDPLMNPDFLEVIRILRARRLPFGMVCNGHLLKPRIIEALASYPQHVEFNVSIDSLNPELYEHIRGAKIEALTEKLLALRAARDAHPESGFTLSIMMVGMDKNIEELPAMLEFCKRVGAKTLKIQHLVGENEGFSHLRENPRWREAVSAGLDTAAETSVQLSLPKDARPESPDSAHTSPPCEDEAPAPANRVHSKPSPKILCSRIDNVQIKIDGTLTPCCHLPSYPLRMNVFDGPLYENINYLSYRLHFISGGIIRECLPAPNCHAMQEIRMKKAKGEPLPALNLDVEGLKTPPV